MIDIAIENCSIDGCDRPVKARGWCPAHYLRWRLKGDPEFPRKWTPAPKGSPCCVCGSPDLMPRSRRYCSARCAQLMHSAKRKGLEAVPTTATCRDCGDAIDLTDLGPAGRKRRADTQRCRDCYAQRGMHKVSAKVLARRDGTACGVCGDDIDMTLKPPDPMSVSIDRIIPRHAGGGEDPGNLQLAHRHCNQRKSTGFIERTNPSFYYKMKWRRFAAQVRQEEPHCRQCGDPTWAASHIVPLHSGGDPWDRSNVQGLCRPCNIRKAASDYFTYCAEVTA